MSGAVELSPDQLAALESIPDIPTYGRCFYITGKAGTGKSTLLREFVLNSPLKKVVLAPTGIAAINVGGQTIHSFFNFHLGPIENDPDQIVTFRKGGAKRKLIENLDCIIIDEVSMVRADIMDAIDFSLRLNTDINEPFGGKTMLFVGDLWQLEPVVAGKAEEEMLEHRYQSPFFFDSDAVRATSLDVIELSTVHRQREDPEFLWALNRLRRGDVDELEFFNSRVGASLEGENIITLTATNSRANAINLTELAKLPGKGQIYKGTIEGDFGKDLPSDMLLNLKPGAQVMFTKNGRQWVNGTLGTVLSLEDEVIVVKTDRGETVAVEREEWEKRRFTWDRHSYRIDAELVGSYLQFPLRLAWAVTIHKSQGLTFDRLILDLDRTGFAHGQLYVALSRCRSLAGVSLKRKIEPRDSVVHSRIWEFERMAGLTQA